MICVVENVKEVMVIESTRQFHGLYHVLGGLISPLDGIRPHQLQISSLITRVSESLHTYQPIVEVLLALSTKLEGDMTSNYILGQLHTAGIDIRVTTLARGVSVGDEIEYADEVTLGRSILNRTLLCDSVQKK